MFNRRFLPRSPRVSVAPQFIFVITDSEFPSDILWDDGTPILWDDGSPIQWDNFGTSMPNNSTQLVPIMQFSGVFE